VWPLTSSIAIDESFAARSVTTTGTNDDAFDVWPSRWPSARRHA
jgi:hypothetical protein